MSTGVRHAPPNLLSVLTMPGPGQEPWVQEPGAFRIVMDPGLGWPLGPFVVVFTPQEVNVDTLDSARWTLFGETGDLETVEREAWLVIAARDEDSEPGLVDIELADFDEPPEVAVVRHIGDSRLGLATRTEPPYRLVAPAITTLRIRGHCRISSVLVSSVFPDVSLNGHVLLGAPVNQISGRYYGIDPNEEKASQRVQTGAPRDFAPHESLPPPGAEAPIEELHRVQRLADLGLRDSLRAVLAAPPGEHAAMSAPTGVDGHPAATHARMQDRMTALIAGTDIGLARWLGLADQLPDFGVRTMTVTAMGVWALHPDHPLFRHGGALSEREYVSGYVNSAGLEMVGVFARELENQGMQSLWLFSQAWVDLGIPPDRPPPPGLATPVPPVWIRGQTEDDDVAIVPIETTNVAVLGQVGLSRTDPSPGSLHEKIRDSERLRSQLAVEGPALNDRVVSPFGARTYVGRQSDAFGRWSDDITEFTAPPVSRVPLAVPDAMVRILPSTPAGDQPWIPDLLVRVGIPPRAGGQRATTQVRIEVAGEPHFLDAVGQMDVEAVAASPAIAPGGTASIPVTVTFLAADGSKTSASPITVSIVDPRPPPPSTPPPVLNFTTRPDATGVAAAVVPLPASPGVSGYLVEVAREGDLVVASGAQPPAGASRDKRAQFWLQQPLHTLARAFYRLTPSAVRLGVYRYELPGDLAELVAFRLVPVGANQASPEARNCGLSFFAVPRDVAPPPPTLLIDRTDTPAVLEVRAAPGAVRAADVRIRALGDPHADPRTGHIVATGTLQDGAARIDAPAAEPARVVTYVAEVRGESEVGAAPAPGRWSAPSDPVRG